MSLKDSFFIIGTDTDIGKTYVSSLLYKGLKKFGCSYFKPIQSGGEDGIAPDVESLCLFNNIPYSKEMAGYIFREPLSPHLASELEKIEISKDSILKKVYQNDKDFNFNLIEGAGGLFVPLVRDGFNLFDLVKEVDVPVILVASTKVGTINHTMLTLEFLKSKGIPLKGIIFNRYSGSFYEDDNINIIKKMGAIDNYLIISSNEVEIEEKLLLEFMKG